MAVGTRSDARDRPWRTRWSDVWPFVAVALMGVAILPFGWRRASLWIVGLFIVLTLLTLAMIAISIHRHRRTWMTTAAPLMVFVDLALARYLAGPTVASGIAPLVLLPVLWIALRGTRVELMVAGAMTAAFFWVPAAFIGPPAYTAADWYRGLLCAAIALLVAPVIQRVVRKLAAAHAQERRASRRAEAVTTRWRALLTQLPDTVVAAVGEQDGRISVLERLGGSDELQDEFAAIIRRHLDPIRDLLQRVPDGRAEVELPDPTSGRTLAVVAVPLPDTTPVETLLVVRDISREKQREWALERSRRQLAYLADHDPASGLLNRRRFDHLLAEHLVTSNTGALLMLDLDLFKQVNDTLGHAAGDRLIVRISDLLRDELRDTDAVARLGGDEFAVLLPDADSDDAEKVAARLVGRVKESVATMGERFPPVTASVGVATVAASRSRGVDPMMMADIMLYEAKESGRGRYAVFDDPATELPAAARTATRQERITSAMEEDRLVLHLQPVLDVALGRVVSAEALVRLREGDRLVAPAEFIEAAEQTDLITRLDCHILRNGIAILAQLRRQRPDFRLAINVSARSVGEPVLEQTILESLGRHRLPGSALIVEVTETAAVAEIDHAQAFAERMRELGCSLALDDFGSGFGTFARLKRLAFDYIKIYGEFVAAAGESEVDCAVLRSIIRVAHDLDKRVVAEHVSDQQTLDLVLREGVDLVQGFHVGRPMPLEDFVERFLQSPIDDPARTP